MSALINIEGIGIIKDDVQLEKNINAKSADQFVSKSSLSRLKRETKIMTSMFNGFDFEGIDPLKWSIRKTNIEIANFIKKINSKEKIIKKDVASIPIYDKEDNKIKDADISAELKYTKWIIEFSMLFAVLGVIISEKKREN